MKLNEIEKGSKIYEECNDDSKYIIFNHLDGMYSHCTTEKGETVHLSRFTPLKEFEDGYKIDEEKELEALK
jgi:hypothetical protein